MGIIIILRMESNQPKFPPGKKKERGKMQQFSTHNLEDLAKICEQKGQERKYIYISDASGRAATFFEYQFIYELFHFHGYVKRAIVPPQMLTHWDCAETFRKKLVHCMENGKSLVVNLDTMVP